MPCIYFLFFLLTLLPLSTLTTADQYGGAAALDDRPAFTSRFCLRGPRSKFQNHLQQSAERDPEKTSTIDAVEEETTEPENISEDDEEETPTTVKVAAKKSKEIRSDDKGSDNVKNTEGSRKYRTAAAAAPAPAPFKRRRSNFDDFEDIN